jgi:hypothetical protein
MRLLPALALVCAATPAAAHVAPSPNVNNRYLKATLLPGEVRLAFTLFLGDRPGAAARRRMDADGNGRIDDAEAKSFGARTLAEIAPGLHVVLDGRPADGWQVADVGLGLASATGGAVSVDLALVVPYADPQAAEHTLRLDDGVQLADPGEGELLVEESPGVRVLESHLADERGGVEIRFPFMGNPGAPGERAVDVRFAVDPALRPAPARRTPWLAGVAVGAALLVLLGRLGRRLYRKVYG